MVTEKGTKRWALRLTIGGRRVEKGLGIYPEVSLEAARQRAAELRLAAKSGIDLQEQEKKARLRDVVTFRSSFEQFFTVRRRRLSNGKHVQQWQNIMRDYVFAAIGDLPVADIGAGEILELLTPIWFEKPETASRVLQRVRATFDSAILRGFREKANPCVGIAGELGTSHRALHWKDVPGFFAGLDTRELRPATRRLFKFLILTASRSGEARGAVWSEFDLESLLWIVPAERMKAGAEHVVPLSKGVLGIMEESRGTAPSELLFPGHSGQPLSDSTLSKAIRDWGVPGTPHGFRSAFKDWAAEN